ncbi:hypothetical protein GCM10022258_19570 [Aquimarina gracilis]
MDENTKKLLEFVHVYTKDSYTLTNADRKFELEVDEDSIHFNFIGCKKTTRNVERNSTILDTVYMKK